jgi:hypothetical protein
MPLPTVTATAACSAAETARYVGIFRTDVHTSVCALYFCVVMKAVCGYASSK